MRYVGEVAIPRLSGDTVDLAQELCPDEIRVGPPPKSTRDYNAMAEAFGRYARGKHASFGKVYGNWLKARAKIAPQIEPDLRAELKAACRRAWACRGTPVYH